MNFSRVGSLQTAPRLGIHAQNLMPIHIPPLLQSPDGRETIRRAGRTVVVDIHHWNSAHSQTINSCLTGAVTINITDDLLDLIVGGSRIFQSQAGDLFSFHCRCHWCRFDNRIIPTPQQRLHDSF